ncbi:MAG: hypothetical protein ABI318_04535 [Chthoniobacteraceae bacterium]
MTNSDKIESLRRLPWYSVDLPDEVTTGVGMIHYDERRLLYTLARDYFSGAGRIVDGGAFFGTSSLSLGFGLRDRDYKKERVIDAFDIFILESYGLKHYCKPAGWFGKKLRAGDNMRFIYERNIAPVAEYISVHEGDLLNAPWNSGPIEILFSDISKSWQLNDHIIRNWIAALIPETGILIQQDQVQEYHVWVAITMEMLADYFEIIDYTPFSSMVFRLKSEIPAQVLEKCMSANITNAEKEHYYLSFLNRFRRVGMGRYKGWTLGMVEVGLAVTYQQMGDLDKARHTLKQCEEKFRNVPDTLRRVAEIRKSIGNA